MFGKMVRQAQAPGTNENVRKMWEDVPDEAYGSGMCTRQEYVNGGWNKVLMRMSAFEQAPLAGIGHKQPVIGEKVPTAVLEDDIRPVSFKKAKGSPQEPAGMKPMDQSEFDDAMKSMSHEFPAHLNSWTELLNARVERSTHVGKELDVAWLGSDDGTKFANQAFQVWVATRLRYEDLYGPNNVDLPFNDGVVHSLGIWLELLIEFDLQPGFTLGEHAHYYGASRFTLQPSSYEDLRKLAWRTGLEAETPLTWPQASRVVKLLLSSHLLQCAADAVYARGTLQLWLVSIGFQPTVKQLPQHALFIHRWSIRTLLDRLAMRYEKRLKFQTAYVTAKFGDLLQEYPARPDFVNPLENTFLQGPAYNHYYDLLARRQPASVRLRALTAVKQLKKRQPLYPAQASSGALSGWYRSIFGPRTAKRVPGTTCPAEPGTGRPGPTEKDVFDLEDTVVWISQTLKKALNANATPTLSVPGGRSRIGAKRAEGGAFGAERAVGGVLAEGQGYIRYPVASIEVKDAKPVVLFALVPERTLANYTIEHVEGVVQAHGVQVQPVVLPEGLKLRMISKSFTTVYEYVRSIQACIHSSIQSLPGMRVTRESPDHDITDVLNNVLGELGPDELYVAGDYSAATDNLLSWLSDLIVDSLCDEGEFDDHVRSIFKACLTGHSATLTPELQAETGLPELISQTNGQLMGSPVSFPILCLANLALTLAALRQSETELPENLARTPMRSGIVINGDDVAFKATRAAIENWKRLTAAFGLTPSVGKNLVSTEFVELNSKTFTRSAGPEGAWSQVMAPSLSNLAPARGLSLTEFVHTGPTLQADYLAPFQGAERDRQNKLWHFVWQPYFDRASRLSRGVVNWYLPRHVGGLGFEPWGSYSVNLAQARVAAYYVAQPSKAADADWSGVSTHYVPPTTTVHAEIQSALRGSKPMVLNKPVAYNYPPPGTPLLPNGMPEGTHRVAFHPDNSLIQRVPAESDSEESFTPLLEQWAWLSRVACMTSPGTNTLVPGIGVDGSIRSCVAPAKYVVPSDEGDQDLLLFQLRNLRGIAAIAPRAGLPYDPTQRYDRLHVHPPRVRFVWRLRPGVVYRNLGFMRTDLHTGQVGYHPSGEHGISPSKVTELSAVNLVRPWLEVCEL